jgi:hypothetical protein
VRSKDNPRRITYSEIPLGESRTYEALVLYRPRTKTGLDLDEPYASAYASLDQAATKPAVWVVIGYSFRDQPIQRVLERAAVRRTIQRLIILDPAEQLPVPQELGEVVKHIRMEFGDPAAIKAVLEASGFIPSEEG